MPKIDGPVRLPVNGAVHAVAPVDDIIEEVFQAERPAHAYLPDDAEPVKVLEADCLDVLRALPDGCVDVVLTDPPYGISFKSMWRAKTFDKVDNDAQPFIWWIYDAARVLRDGGALIIMCRWDVQEPFRLALIWSGLVVRGQIIWDRVMHGMGDLTGAPGPQHDVIWYATKGTRKFAGERPKSVIRIVTVATTGLRHPTEKPVALMRQFIRFYTKVDDVILDPFAGAGTTGVAAIMEDRKCLLVEKDTRYVDVCRQRLEEVTQNGSEKKRQYNLTATGAKCFNTKEKIRQRDAGGS